MKYTISKVVYHSPLQVWLIEINVNPALHINCSALKEVIPGVVEETLRKLSVYRLEPHLSGIFTYPDVWKQIVSG